MTGIISGQLNPRNKDAIDWHPKGLVGYGCHTVLTIVDVSSYKTIQTLCGHEKTINLVKFGLQESLDENAYGLKCVSSDISGKLIVWAVIQGKKEISFQKPGDEVIQMQWYTNYDFYTDLLLTLHASNTLVLWNTKNGEKFWILNFSSKIFDFGIDPRNYTNIAFAATNSIVMFLKNVTISDTPILSDTNLQTIKFSDEGSSSDENQIVQIAFHKAYEDLLFAIFPSKVVLLHTESKQIISTVNTENMFPLCRILPCSERDAFYLVHSNGVISFWRAFIQNHKDRFIAELSYDQVSYNDAQRFFSKNRIFGAQLCPTTESTLGLLFNSGKLVFYQLNHNDQITILPYRVQSLADITPFDTSKENKSDKLCFMQSGMVPSLGSNATTVRIRPMDKIQMPSSQFGGKHLAALGSSTGSIQFIDVLTGKLEKELNIHNCAVKCLEWAGCDYIVSAAYSSSITANGSVRNDIFVTNVLTGAKSRLRPEADESPVQLLRISFYQRYLAIAFRNDPLEIWDLFSNRLLRRMSRKCPIIVDMVCLIPIFILLFVIIVGLVW
jgi:WD40 repeat protein